MTTNLNIDRRAISAFCDRWHVRELSLFGSVLRPDFSERSDVDILVEFEPGATITLFDLVEMQIQLKAIVGRDVDVVDKRGLAESRNHSRRRAILDSARVIHAA